MTTPNNAELLALWPELAQRDPERFHVVAKGTVLEERAGQPYAVAGADSYTFRLDDGWRVFLPGSEWLVIGAVTQAAHGRGWRCGFTTGRERDKGAFEVWMIASGQIERYRDDLALAFAQAYVAALRYEERAS
ncbi:hypothetical protein [Deinococcus pimensis]|uniref:hypothetical protein n=1 Tax=Deinococcus pimensis TaxID=309888 RepID=UPI0004841D5A|nr:hypothetical protein [Deinococcus pimensis]